jgi:putative phage-type endonuclease
MAIFKFDTEAQWLGVKSKDITSTEVAPLMGISPYKTRYRLWQEKAGNIESDFEDSPFTRWGRRLQIPVALGIADDMGWSCKDLTLFYARHPTLRLGASMDHEIGCEKRGRGLQEVKTTSFFTSEGGWEEEAAPIEYECQLQTQLHLAHVNGDPFNFGVISALDGRKNTKNYFRVYDAKFGAKLEHEVEAFWQSIIDNKPPEPDYIADQELIQMLLPKTRPKEKRDFTNNPQAVELLKIYDETELLLKPLREQIKPLENRRKEAKNQLLSMIGNAEYVTIGKTQIVTKEVEKEDAFVYGSTRRTFNLRKLK